MRMADIITEMSALSTNCTLCHSFAPPRIFMDSGYRKLPDFPELPVLIIQAHNIAILSDFHYKGKHYFTKNKKYMPQNSELVA